MKDLIIIGTGPGGVTAAIYAKRSNLDLLVFEKNCVGGNVVNAFEIENYPGVGKIVGADLSINFLNELDALGIEVNYEEIKEVKKIDDHFKVITTDDIEYEAKKVLLALGTKARKLNLENEDALLGRGVSFCATCDGAFYKNKIVLVVGGGNSALTEAMYLSNIASKVYVITRHQLKGTKKEIDELKGKKNVEVIEFKQIKELVSENKHLKSVILFDTNTKEEMKLDVDGVFVYIGQIPQTVFLSNLGILNERGFINVDKHFETSVKGLFAIGDCIDKEVRQIATAVGDAATAIHYLEK